MRAIGRCECGLPTICGVCLSFALVVAPFATIGVLIWSAQR